MGSRRKPHGQIMPTMRQEPGELPEVDDLLCDSEELLVDVDGRRNGVDHRNHDDLNEDLKLKKIIKYYYCYLNYVE